jgi:diguanylate cyclase (GGDEF)-like protein
MSLSIATNADETTESEQTLNKLDSASFSQESNVALSINEKIISLKMLSEKDRAGARIKLSELETSALTFNQAEQYILHIVRANIANVAGQESTVINYLHKAIELETSLAKSQLDDPLFASAYLIRANIYEKQGDEKAAFDSKKQYIKKYFAHLKQQKELRVKGLHDKYNIEKNYEENELLGQNNQIKQYALTRAESDRKQQLYNIAIFIAAVIVLFVLLLRQFSIRRALKLLAKTDSLTYLANRRSFFERGSIFMEQAISEGSELSVLMLDIDHFKKINNNFGHEVGDKAICHVAALASETMRSRDFLARIGGEEFAAILPDANIEQARAIAEHMREKIQDNTRKSNGENVHVTVSIGLASIRDVSESFDSLLHAADMAMHQAKAEGCNQVCSYSTERK